MPRLKLPQRELLKAAFAAGVEACQAGRVLPRVFEEHAGRTGLIGIGKAGVAMAATAMARLPSRPVFAFAATRRRHVPPKTLGKLEVIEAGHPNPDGDSLRAGARALYLASTLGPQDRLLALVSGGGSAVLAQPARGLLFEDKKRTVAALSRAGASIAEINIVRGALSAIKAGRLGAAANGALVETFVISDVPGDDAALVASGPTLPPHRGDALTILRDYRIEISPNVHDVLQQRDPVRQYPTRSTVVARADDALWAAANVLDAAGYRVINDGGALEGDAVELGRSYARRAHSIRAEGGRVALLSGGETTVTLPMTGGGRGGRNTVFLLALALELQGELGVSGIAADTDGIDGSEDNAGAFCDPESLGRMREAGIDPFRALERADAYSAFEASGDLLVTGPTLTNVNDLRIVLIDS